MSRHSMRGGLHSLRGLLSNQASTTLIVGDIDRWSSEGRMTESSTEYVFAQFGDLNDELLSQTKPEVILSPLIADDFDAVDMVLLLAKLQYNWPYRAVSGPLGDPALVRDELSKAAPFLDVDLIVMPNSPI